MKKSAFILKAFVLLVISIVSCNNPSNFENGDPGAHSKAPVLSSSENDENSMVGKATIERKLIRNCYLELQVSDVAKAKEAIEKTIKEHNAYASSETQSNLPERFQYEQVIRIPFKQFDAVVQKLEKLSTSVESKNIQISDVTEEFIDKEARIKTKKELETRYHEILKQARTVTDILSIESHLNQVRSDIEAMEGRMNYLRNQVAFSTLNVIYYQSTGTDFGFGTKIIQSISNGWRYFLIFIIGVFNIWPFTIIALAFTYVLIRKWRTYRTIK